ncbi:HTH_Tnp_Tc3_2 domain-containing protein [Trichonephila clavipes]|nr:HTH_Tnp_Tc3_2 domain-containing protein [Trichonephila clavipes]
MGPQRETSIDVRKFILRLFKKGKYYREIAKIVGRSHSCVQKIIGRFKSDGLIENKNGRGRKSILSDVSKRKVLKVMKIDPKLSAVKLASETSRIMGRSVVLKQSYTWANIRNSEPRSCDEDDTQDRNHSLKFHTLPTTKLPVRLTNTTNELVQGHETTPLKVKVDIEDVYSELDN